MIARYHLDLAAVALAIGAVMLVVTLRVPPIADRAVALAAAFGAVLASLSTSAGVFWVIPAALVVLPADDHRRPHPLGRFTLLLTVSALAGIWAAVPDTEPPIATALLLLPLAVWSFAHHRAPGPRRRSHW